MADADILTDLPLLFWQGLQAPPYDMLTGEWKNILAPRRVPYVNGELHDDVGRGSVPMGARLYFCNGLSGGPANVRLYPDYWEQWKPLLLSGAAGDLRHPVFGPLRARVEGGKFELRATVRSGIIVDVTWVETVEDPASNLDLADVSYQLPAGWLAAQADAAAAAFDVYPVSDLPPELVAVRYGLTLEPGAVATLADIFDAIRPDILAGTLRALSLLTTLLADVVVMIDAIQALDTVYSYQALDALQAFYIALFDMRAGLSRTARTTAVYVPAGRTTLDAVAYRVGNTVREVMGLNIPLLRLSYVERGTPVTYFKAA
jgi:hypothetical protein